MAARPSTGTVRSRTSLPSPRRKPSSRLKLQLDSWRWAGVPFYIRTGKRLPKRTTEIAIQFRRPPLQIFKRVSPSSVAPNLLIVNVQPDEGISVRFEAKLPGTRMQLAPVMMNFRYGTAFGGQVPEAYETLLLDAMLGDPTLFARHDFVEASWALITPVHEAWRAGTGRRRSRPTRPAAGARAEADALDVARWTTMEDAVSETLMESATTVALRRSSLRLARDAAGQSDAAPARALTATVVAVGPRERLQDVVEPLQTLGNSGAIRGILIPQGSTAESGARVASNVVVLNGLPDNFIDNAVAALRLSSLPTVIWWRGGPTDGAGQLDQAGRPRRARRRSARARVEVRGRAFRSRGIQRPALDAPDALACTDGAVLRPAGGARRRPRRSTTCASRHPIARRRRCSPHG